MCIVFCDSFIFCEPVYWFCIFVIVTVYLYSIEKNMITVISFVSIYIYFSLASPSFKKTVERSCRITVLMFYEVVRDIEHPDDSFRCMYYINKINQSNLGRYDMAHRWLAVASETQ